MEIADIFHQYFDKYLTKFGDKIPSNHLKTASDIMTCRTRVKGGEVHYCVNCKTFHYSYHSCKTDIVQNVEVRIPKMDRKQKKTITCKYLW